MPRNLFAYRISKNIANAESKPPERLIIPAVTPLVAKAKTPLTSAIAVAVESPRLPAANMVIMFEKPGFAPGGKSGSGGIRLSRKPSDSANAQSIAGSATLYAGFFFIINKQRHLHPSP